MVRIELGIVDLARTRFGISPLAETVRSLRALADPSQHTLHLAWLRALPHQLSPDDARLLLSLVGASRLPADFREHPSRALPDFLTPLPTGFIDGFDMQLAALRNTPLEVVRRDLVASHAPDPLPEPLRAAKRADTRATRRLLNAICDTLDHFWKVAFEPVWPQMQLVLEADTTYRARQLALGGANLLFADIHPNVSWGDGVLMISEMISDHRVEAGGRGLLLMPSIFATKPVPPLDPSEPPSLSYPSRGVATLWASPPLPEPSAVIDLLGRTRALLLQMLEEPLATIELARRLKVTPSAVNQHLQVLHAVGLLTSTRDRRQVLYRRTVLGDQLVGATSARETTSGQAKGRPDAMDTRHAAQGTTSRCGNVRSGGAAPTSGVEGAPGASTTRRHR
jgi:DNA-binding transcriptional ArsR family regulator